EIADLYLTDAGDDTFRDHGDHNDTIFGQGGDDDIGTSGGQDNFYGGLGDDTLTIDWSDATDHVGLFQGVTYGYVGVDFGSSTRRVDWSSFEHLNVKSGSGDDILEGVANQSDVLDGGAGTDEWDDDFTSLTAAFSIDMAQVSTSTGQTFSDGTTVRNLEIADLYLSNTGGDTFRDSGAYNDTVFGQGGNDDIGTSGGQDYFDGGLGDDTLTIDWSDATDHVGLFQGVTYGFVGVDFGSSTRRVDWTGFEHLNVKSGSSDDTLEGVANQSDILDGGAGTDEWDDDFTNLATGLSIDMALVSSASGQTLSDGSTLRNLEIADLYLSDTGGDTFRDSGSYDDRVYGQGGDDNLGTSGGSDYIDGGAGTDTLVIDWSGTSAPVVISTALTLAYAGSDFASASDRVDWTSMEKLDVTAGNADDTLTALSNGSVMNGGGGNDTVTGDVGDDTLGGGTGADTLAGNDGNDILIGGGGADSIDGGAGNDTASYAGSAVGVNVQLQYGVIQGGDATGDTFTSIENLTGSDQGDTLYGNPSANILMGGGGTDYLKGLNGADKLYGDAGDDWLYVDYLDTVAEGGSGIDRLIVVNANGVTNAVGANGIEIATGNTGNDTFDGSGATADLTLRGRSGNDVLTGGDGDDYLYGDAGIDQLTGGAGLDRLFIDENDTLYNGGAGTQDRILVQQLASATSGVTVDMA
ncbi:MAG: hypothetical protein KDJ77_09555, partial [Rhodobiaceae bacterium]|nr:hypothetical protein [Rhodobiaceae bacterium]